MFQVFEYLGILWYTVKYLKSSDSPKNFYNYFKINFYNYLKKKKSKLLNPNKVVLPESYVSK